MGQKPLISVFFFGRRPSVKSSQSDNGGECQEPVNTFGGVPWHPCVIYTPSTHPEPTFQHTRPCHPLISHCEHIGAVGQKKHRFCPIKKKRSYIYILLIEGSWRKSASNSMIWRGRSVRMDLKPIAIVLEHRLDIQKSPSPRPTPSNSRVMRIL